MSFGYKNITISGSLPEVEGVASFILELKGFMESIGWITEDDRTSQASSTVKADTHKIVMKSNGEDGEFGTFYMTVFSGTTAAQNSNLACFEMQTAYDLGTHDVASTGVVTQATRSTANCINTPSQTNTEYWMSGDSEAIVIVSRNGTTYDSMMAGRANSFLTTAETSYPLYVNAATGNVIITSQVNVKAIAGEPPQAFQGNGEAEFKNPLLTTTNQPYQLGSAISIFTAVPFLFLVDDAAPIRKGLIGTARNAWFSTGTSSGMNQESKLIASGTEGVQVYRAFISNSTQSLVMRES